MHELMVRQPGERPAQPVVGLWFGSVADRYERYRLGYPGELLTAVRVYAATPIRTALEVGAGTGKATRLFAAGGTEVTALEPDAEMAAVLARTTRGLPVEPLATRFETFRTDRRFDLLFAGAAWHWTDPRTRWRRAVELLAPGGVLALFGHPTELKDPALHAAVEDIEERLLPQENRVAGHPWSTEDLAGVEGFTDVEEQRLPGAQTIPSADFIARLTTVSAYLRLEPEHRTEVVRQVRAVLPDRVDIDTTVHLTLARRA